MARRENKVVSLDDALAAAHQRRDDHIIKLVLMKDRAAGQRDYHRKMAEDFDEEVRAIDAGILALQEQEGVRGR